jgi:uncharacterized protein YkwD
MKLNFFHLTAILSATALVVACGGGGGNGTGVSADPNASPPATIYVAPTSAKSLVAPALTSDVATDAIAWMNYRRAQLGLSPMVRNSLLDKSALAHANYLALNTYDEGHSETVGRAGFTGATVPQRILSTGYATTILNENINGAGYKHGPSLVDGLIDAPYHRTSQFGEYAEIGAGSAFSADAASVTGLSYNYVADFGGSNLDWGPSANQILVYPNSGQKNAPTSWIASESPNPVPDLKNQRVGYPISLQARSLSQLKIASFALSDSKGVSITGRLITTANGQAPPNVALWIPLAPLMPGATYTAVATGSLNSAPLNISWSFTTTPMATLTIAFSTNTLAATPSTSVEVKLTGGTGHGLQLIGSTSSYLNYIGQNPGSPVFATVAYNSPTSATITRTAAACNPVVFASCSFFMFGADSSGGYVDLAIAVK